MRFGKRFLAALLAAIAGLVTIDSAAATDDARGDGGKHPKSGPPKFETVAPLSREHGSVAWSPVADLRLPAIAAYDAKGLPVVLYNPRLLAGLPRPIARFLAMRQEVVVTVLEGAKKQHLALRAVEGSDAGRSSTSASSPSVVREEIVYPLVARYGAFGNLSQIAFAPHVIDCFALLFLTSDERQTVAFYANEDSRFFADAFDPPHDLLERGRALTDCPAMDPGYDEDRARQRFLNDWGSVSSR